jgi:uncharacterized membrane protein YczE
MPVGAIKGKWRRQYLLVLSQLLLYIQVMLLLCKWLCKGRQYYKLKSRLWNLLFTYFSEVWWEAFLTRLGPKSGWEKAWPDFQ